jgi:hypothetical protein
MKRYVRVLDGCASLRAREPEMLRRRVTASMLYAQSAPSRWLRGLTCAVDEAAAGLCHAYWQHGRVPALERARIARALPRGAKPIE